MYSGRSAATHHYLHYYPLAVILKAGQLGRLVLGFALWLLVYSMATGRGEMKKSAAPGHRFTKDRCATVATSTNPCPKHDRQKIKVVNQPVGQPDSAGAFQRFIAPASTLPGLARGPEDAERGGVKSTPNPAKQANSAQCL